MSLLLALLKTFLEHFGLTIIKTPPPAGIEATPVATTPPRAPAQTASPKGQPLVVPAGLVGTGGRPRTVEGGLVTPNPNIEREGTIWRPVPGNANAIEVDLAADPKRPFPGAQIEWFWGSRTGWVLVEHKEGTLYVGGKKVAHHLESDQRAPTLKTRLLQANMKGVVLHPNIKTALLENRHLLPESWKVDGEGRSLFTHFWAVGFRHACCQYVEYVCFEQGAWSEGTSCLDDVCNVNGPAAYAGSP